MSAVEVPAAERTDAYTGQMHDGQTNLVRLDGEHTGTPQPGALVLVRRCDGDAQPLRMRLVKRVHRGNRYDPKLRDWPNSIWAVRPER